MNKPNTTYDIVMRRVHRIHAMRTMSASIIVSGAIFVVALWGIGREVWVARVFKNMPSLANVSGVVSFYISAFLDTRFIVQLLVIIVALAGARLAYSIIRSMLLLTRTQTYA